MIPVWICMALYWLYKHATAKTDEEAKKDAEIARTAAEANG